MPAPEILFLKQEEVIEAGVLDMGLALGDVETALAMLGRGEIINPAKTSLKIHHEDGSWRSMLNCMPVYIGGALDRPGVKWASESSRNLKALDLPMGIDVLVLSDATTVLPVAIMDATLITAMRTAANALVAVKYLASPKAREVAVIGAGVIGRTLLMALCELGREFGEVRLYDLRREKAEGLAADFTGKLDLAVAETGEAAVRSAGIVLTATTAKQQVLSNEWLDGCTLGVQVGANEFPGEAILAADRVTLDDWDQALGVPDSPFRRLFDDGLVARDKVTPLCEIVAGLAPGRASANQRILHMSRGLGCLDVMVGERIYRKARELGLGQTLRLWDAPRWL